MTGIEREERERMQALLAKLEREHGPYMQQISQLRAFLYPYSNYLQASQNTNINLEASHSFGAMLGGMFGFH